jgi:folylpolyglutamate synthase/dihydropteroate synthase
VPVHSQRTAMPEMLLTICREANPGAEVLVCDSLAQALQWAASDPFLVVTGSLYLVGEALEHLHLTPAGAAGERGLNEWSAVGSEALAASRCR